MPFQNCDLIRCSSEQLAMESLGGSKISPRVAISNPNRPTALGAKRRRWFPFPTRYRGGADKSQFLAGGIEGVAGACHARIERVDGPQRFQWPLGIRDAGAQQGGFIGAAPAA